MTIALGKKTIISWFYFVPLSLFSFSSFASKVALGGGQIVCNCGGAGTAEINLDLEISDQQLASEKILVNVADTS